MYLSIFLRDTCICNNAYSRQTNPTRTHTFWFISLLHKIMFILNPFMIQPLEAFVVSQPWAARWSTIERGKAGKSSTQPAKPPQGTVVLPTPRKPSRAFDTTYNGKNKINKKYLPNKKLFLFYRLFLFI